VYENEQDKQNKIASFLWNQYKTAYEYGPEVWHFIKVPSDKCKDVVQCLGAVYNSQDFVKLGVDELTVTDKALKHLNDNGYKDIYVVVEKVVFSNNFQEMKNLKQEF